MEDTIYRVKESISSRSTRRDLIMAFDSTGGVMYELNDTASDVFRQIDGKRNVAQIIAEIGAEYDIEHEEVSPDIHEILERFEASGIVETI